MIIMAFDLGKFNSVMCLYNTNTRTSKLETVATEGGYFRSLIVNHKPDLVVVEACGPSGWVSDLCGDLNTKIIVCSTNEAAWMFKNVKRKTDKDDAIKLAKLAAIDQLVPTRFDRFSFQRLLAKNLNAAHVANIEAKTDHNMASERQIGLLEQSV